MKAEEQRIAIAKACGWKLIQGNPSLKKQLFGVHSDPRRERVPDYVNNLNAMNEAEGHLPEESLEDWRRWLSDIVMRSNMLSEIQTFTEHATAAQRAEAFLKTIGKWVES